MSVNEGEDDDGFGPMFSIESDLLRPAGFGCDVFLFQVSLCSLLSSGVS